LRGNDTNTISAIEEQFMDKRIKYVTAAAVAGAVMVAAYYYPAEAIIAFVLWVSPGIPLILIAILIFKLFFEKRRKSV
jgi:hypothetical protein